MLCKRSRSENRNTSKALRSRIRCAVFQAGEKQRKVALSTACFEGEGRWACCAGCLVKRGRPMVGKGRQQPTMQACAPPPNHGWVPWPFLYLVVQDHSLSASHRPSLVGAWRTNQLMKKTREVKSNFLLFSIVNQQNKEENSIRIAIWGFSHDLVVKNLPCNTRDTCWIPGPGRSHMLQSKEAHVPQLLSPCSATPEVHTHPRAHALPQEKPPQREAHAPQQRVVPAHCN